MGWCHYRLGEYDEAMRLFIDAVSLNVDVISTQFYLALTLMCSGWRWRPLAVREYRRGLDLADRKHILKRRGLLYAALRDLKDAVKALPELQRVNEFQEGRKLLEEALEKAKSS